MIEVLVIDDDEKICLFFTKLLARMGHQCHKAHTLEQARSLFHSHACDLVLLDLELPDGNGLDLLPEFTASDAAPEIIIITGTGDARGARLAFKYGAWDYIQKPFLLDEVGDLPLNAQKSMLRSLQERCIRPVGGGREISVNIRLIAATNLNLDQMVADRTFRKDLLYRIRAMEIHLPRLRDRENDIEEIIIKKLHELTRRYHMDSKAISDELLKTVSEKIGQDYDTFFDTNARGVTISDHLDGALREQDVSFSDRDYFIAARNTGKVAVGQAILSRNTHYCDCRAHKNRIRRIRRWLCRGGG